MRSPLRFVALWLLATAPVFAFPLFSFSSAPPAAGEILTPPAPPDPRINGPSVFGVRPGAPFLYAIPATGERPMTFAADGLPAGLVLDAATGRITGKLEKAGDCAVTLRAKNAKGAVERKFRIVAGEAIALTPPMGWNSWNCWAAAVDQGKVEAAARALVSSGLAQHGWTYVNIDDTWQGRRDSQTHALQPNDKFPDLKGLCDTLHGLGLKAGIYSTPWLDSYANFPGGSSDHADGAWTLPTYRKRFGTTSFAAEDARQWAAWGIDYLEYDWNPISVPETGAMARALRASGRDIVFSLSNSADPAHAADWARLANCWRTTGDITDTWKSVRGIGFAQDKWAPFAGPGHWNDPDMLVVGQVGWGPKIHPTRLTADEQYTHITLWCLLSAPLLLGCDLDQLDPFTLNLLTNDEVLAVDQDALGKQAVNVSRDPEHPVFKKELEDGSLAVGLFNLGDSPAVLSAWWADLGLQGEYTARDLWRQKDRGHFGERFIGLVPAHGVVLVRLTAAK